METYLQTAWGDQWDNVTMEIVREAIDSLKQMDDEHGAFWVGLVKEEENILEVHNDLQIMGVFEEEPEIRYLGQMKKWNEVEMLYEDFLADKFPIVKSRLKKEENKL